MHLSRGAKGEGALTPTRGLSGRLLRALTVTDEPTHSDLIFVLAGHQARKVVGASLFTAGYAPAILMSTGDPAYVAAVMRRPVAHAAAETVVARPGVAAHGRSRRRQFFAGVVDSRWTVFAIDPGHLGTMSEIRALGGWLRGRPDVRSVLILSIGPHLHRIRLCCRALLPADRVLRFIPTGSYDAEVTAAGADPERVRPRSAFTEWGKVLMYAGVLAARRSFGAEP